MFGFRAEPAAVSEAIRMGMVLLATLGVVQFTDIEVNAVVAAVGSVWAAVSVLLTFFTRQSVTSQETLEKAGVSQDTVVRVASDPTKTLVVSSH